MIEVVTPELISAYEDEIEAMHRLRHRVLKERLNWEVRSIAGLEIDIYDMLEPTYLLAKDEENEVCGVWRMLPTTGPYMMRDVFPELLGGRAAPCHPAIWEMSRIAVDYGPQETQGLNGRGRITGELFCGLVEHCLNLGITHVLAAYDVRISRILPRIGCQPLWASDIQPIGNTRGIGGCFEISQAVLNEIRLAVGFTDSVIKPPKPFDEAQAA